jgi:NAD-dependent dihydropyrimidine dehydrogenase PreA subunit
VLESTREFLRQSGLRLRTLHGYIYGRWTHRYVKTLLTPAGAPGKASRIYAAGHHGKVLTNEHARAIIALDRPIPLTDLEQIIPYPVARSILLDGPPDVVAFECSCRHARASHCEPTRVCMVIGKPMTDFVLEHQPASAERLTQAQALALLEAEHARGHVHAAWFKDAMLDRFYAICNCCKCCCGGLAVMRKGVNIVASSGYVAQIDQTLCGNCGECVEACPFNALAQEDGVLLRDWEKCMGCGVCEVKCAAGAISLARDERKGIPLDVRALQPKRTGAV